MDRAGLPALRDSGWTARPGRASSMKCGSRITAKRPPNMKAGVLTKGGETAGGTQERTTGSRRLDACLNGKPFDGRV
jgi:hypothetical protein